LTYFIDPNLKNQGVVMCRKTNAEINPLAMLGRCCLGLIVFSMLGSCAGKSDKVVTEDTVKSVRPDTIIATQIGKEVSFDEMMADLNRHQIIFVGEQHTNASHHSIQLKIIQASFQSNHDLAVGMEMFDRSYQEVLDFWSAGVLDESAFLRKTHWYANWRYDFALYRDILLFIQQNRIKLVGLNYPFTSPAAFASVALKAYPSVTKGICPKK
jgi:uncharacterized iron-regulated protein